ncbi:MAG TPA: alcohol dehydrogenase catalytic domain-containing protein [Nitrososphaerales archaeon]|nr:alcohol dehydrogenase catalytic domain-containing protein [Nitrososphaerales archaeon]
MKSVILVPRKDGRSGLIAQVEERPDPLPGPGELVVDMKACGLCGTDLEKMKGEYTASLPVIGHEAVGSVSALGPGVGGLKKGDRVFPHHHVPCYECYICKAGNETMCDRYRSSYLDPSGFSESFRVPAWNVEKGGVLKMPPAMSYEVGSLIEPLACCVRAVRMCRVRRTDTVLIAGAGPVGMMHALLLKPMGAKVLLSDVSETRLELAERYGAGLALDASRVNIPDRMRSETQGRGADLAIVASGSRDAIIQGLRSIRRGGRVCLFGVPSKGSILDYDISLLYNAEQGILTSYGATEEDTKEALKVLSSRGEEFARLITHWFPLARFDDAVAAASEARAMKVVVTP